MKFTVLLAVGLCIAAISEATVAKAVGHVRACKPKHKKHQKDQEHPPVTGHPRPRNKPTCKGVECTNGQVCRLVQVQCLVAPCPPIASCVPKDKSGEWIDSEEDWIDDTNSEREPEEFEEKDEQELAGPLPKPHPLISRPVRNHSDGGPNDAAEVVPAYEAPIYIEAPWKGDRTVANRPETIVNKLEPAKIPNLRKQKFENAYNPDSHKNPIPNSGEVPVGTRIPYGPNSSLVTDANPEAEVPEYIVHPNHSHDGEHGIGESPDNPVSVTEPGHGGERGAVDIPDPESQVIGKGQISSVGERPPKVRACRPRKHKHRHDRTPK